MNDLVEKYGQPGAIPPVIVDVPADRWDNIIREWGVIYACEWFGHGMDSEETEFTVKTLLERSGLFPAQQTKQEYVLRKALVNLVTHVERETCTHEETHRGGAIWTICDSCGKKWADDEGGFQPYQEPPALYAAYEALSHREAE